jgi:hypothetical protein
MPRNGSGSASLAEPAFIPNTAISSAAVNSDLSDIADMLTGSLARDGQGGMTAVLPLANTGFTYLTDPNTGMRRTAADTQAISAGGVDAVTITSTAVDVVALKVAGSTVFPVPTAQIADKAVTLAKLYHPTATSRLLGSDSNAALVITGAAAAAGLIRLSVASTATFATSQVKTVSDVVGTTEANGTWTITVVDATHIDLQGSTFTTAYVSGGTIGGGVEEISLGIGLTLAGSVLSTSFPPSGLFRNLSIKVATNTTIAVVADQVVTTDGTNYQTTALSVTINMASTGINALDFGSIAAATWYAIWAVTKADGTTGATASLQGTANATFLSHLPAGYTGYARIGWVRTAAGSAQLLGSWQLGRRAQYVVGLAQTSALPQIGTAAVSGAYVSYGISNFVPTTASEIAFQGVNNTATATIAIAPNNSYATHGSTTNPPPFQGGGAAGMFVGVSGNMLLESTNIFVEGAGSGSYFIFCLGWNDNI